MNVCFVVVDANTGIPKERLARFEVFEWLLPSVAIASDRVRLR
jgi:hypothetical protein